MRLIDLDELQKFPIRLNHYDRINGDEKYVFGVEAVIEYAENLPTVDAEPVRHGELKSTGFDEIYCEWGDCSECGADNRINAKFCNNCGVRLDGRDGAR